MGSRTTPGHHLPEVRKSSHKLALGFKSTGKADARSLLLSPWWQVIKGTVNIQVGDVNDNAPRFHNQPYSVRIPEVGTAATSQRLACPSVATLAGQLPPQSCGLGYMRAARAQDCPPALDPHWAWGRIKPLEVIVAWKWAEEKWPQFRCWGKAGGRGLELRAFAALVMSSH